MDESRRRLTFLGILAFLVLAIIVTIIYVNRQTPVSSNTNVGTSIVDDKTADDGMVVIKDVNDGEMQIPKYNIPESSYSMDDFTEEDGIISYKGETRIGISVSQQHGTIDWQMVKDSGVDFVFIRVGYRGVTDGKIYTDMNFDDNMLGATEAGIDIGVYFYSHAVTEAEAEEEAGTVIQKIALYQVTYPIAFLWEFTPEDKVESGTPRTQGCTADQVTRFSNAFCTRVKQAGFQPMFSIDKQMGYEYFNLETLKDYDIWYTEYKQQPAFHYNFTIWQYSSEGNVPGIDDPVKMSYSFVDYAG